MTLGGGISLDVGGFRFILDYAWADRGRLNQTQHFTLGIFFENSDFNKSSRKYTFGPCACSAFLVTTMVFKRRER